MGKFDWILTVLTDVSTFAAQNNLQGLKRHIDDARRVAEREIFSVASPSNLHDNEQEDGL